MMRVESKVFLPRAFQQSGMPLIMAVLVKHKSQDSPMQSLRSRNIIHKPCLRPVQLSNTHNNDSYS